jgi:hypothetical protein
MSDAEIVAALVAGWITALAILLGIPLIRWIGAKRRERIAAAEDARIDALVDSACEHVKKMESGSQSTR